MSTTVTMSTTASAFSAPKFDYRMFAHWRSRFNIFLMGKKAQKCLQVERPVHNGAAGEKAKQDWDDRNDVACASLAEACEHETGARNVVMTALEADPRLTCAQILALLEAEYDARDNVYIAAKQREFTNLAFLSKERAGSFMARIQEKKTELANLGKAVDDDVDCLGILLNALDREERFRHMTAAIRMTADVTWEMAKRAIIRSEALMLEPPRGLAEKSNYAGGQAGSGGPDGEACQICGRIGHTASTCFHRFKKGENKRKRDDGGKKDATDNFEQPPKKKDLSGIKCYNCQKMGHYSNKCPDPKETKAGNPRKPWDANPERSGMMREEIGQAAQN
jgi:hypothetical protein